MRTRLFRHLVIQESRSGVSIYSRCSASSPAGCPRVLAGRPAPSRAPLGWEYTPAYAAKVEGVVEVGFGWTAYPGDYRLSAAIGAEISERIRRTV